MILPGQYKEFRNNCKLCMYGTESGCEITAERYKEHYANETLENLPCKGLGIEPAIQNSIFTSNEELENTGSTVITYTNYDDYKTELRNELNKSAESFVRIGYLLKVARDTRILEDSGYENVNEFAYKEFGLDKTQVSRFMRINDRFSEDGYSERLKVEYQGFGYAKLSIMLLLPDSINEELTPDYSKSEIQALKEEVDAEAQVSDIEVMIEEKDARQQALDGILAQVAYEIGKEDSKMYCTLWESQMERNEDVSAFMEKLAPSGNKTYSVRIPGTGRMMLLIKDAEDEVKLINVRDISDKRTYMKQNVVDAFRSIFEVGTAKESWKSTYGEDFPEEKEEVAPVQQVQRKESKVTKVQTAKIIEKKKASKEEKTVEAEEQQSQEAETMTLHDIQEDLPAPSPVPEEVPEKQIADTEMVESEEQQLPGQDSIENHPEYMPDPQETQEELQSRAKQIVEMSLIVSMNCWKDKKMPIDVIRRNKNNAQRVVELFEKMEKLTTAESEE